MYHLNCIGKNGKHRIFKCRYTYDEHNIEWGFFVETDPPPVSREFFELRVKQINPSIVRVVAMYHNDEPEYIAAGIPDALLPLIREVVGKTVCSSPSLGSGNVYRTSDATKVWKRLAINGIAEYKEEDDVFCIP